MCIASRSVSLSNASGHRQGQSRHARQSRPVACIIPPLISNPLLTNWFPRPNRHRQRLLAHADSTFALITGVFAMRGHSRPRGLAYPNQNFTLRLVARCFTPPRDSVGSTATGAAFAPSRGTPTRGYRGAKAMQDWRRRPCLGRRSPRMLLVRSNRRARHARRRTALTIPKRTSGNLIHGALMSSRPGLVERHASAHRDGLASHIRVVE
jgi:hypothetical protein